MHQKKVGMRLTALSLIVLGISVAGPVAAQPKTLVPKVWLTLPVTARGLSSTVTRISITSRVPMGIEFVSTAEDMLQSHPVPQSVGQFYDLTGLSPMDACQKVTMFAKDYECEQLNGVLHIRPRSFRNKREVCLNRPLREFDLDAPNAADTLFEVHRIFDSQYPNWLSTSGVPRFRQPERIRPGFSLPTAIEMRSGTVRDLLDAVILSRGEMSWSAEYRGSSGDYHGLRLSLISFDNWSVHADARK